MYSLFKAKLASTHFKFDFFLFLINFANYAVFYNFCFAISIKIQFTYIVSHLHVWVYNILLYW